MALATRKLAHFGKSSCLFNSSLLKQAHFIQPTCDLVPTVACLGSQYFLQVTKAAFPIYFHIQASYYSRLTYLNR
jgi:hypothetical protein